MGLDMYLEKCNRTDDGNLLLENIFEWRKAYVIMDFFNTKLGCDDDFLYADNCNYIQNCARYTLDRDMLKELLDLCNRFLGEGGHTSTEGFHVLDELIDYWSNEDDDYDYQKHWIVKTKKFLDEHLSNLDEAFNDFYMFHAWW